MQKLTKVKTKAVQAKWFLIDAAGVRLGKLSTTAANLLLGKNLVDAVAHQVSGQGVIIINSDKVSYFPTREKNKFYARHSGYPGGFRQISLGEQMRQDSRQVIQDAITGMLPKNKLRKVLLQKLKIYTNEVHEHEAQQPEMVNIK